MVPQNSLDTLERRLEFAEFIAACEEMVRPLRAAINHIELSCKAESAARWLPTSRLQMDATVFWAGKPFATITTSGEPGHFRDRWIVRAVNVPIWFEGFTVTVEEAVRILASLLDGHLASIEDRARLIGEARTILASLKAAAQAKPQEVMT